MKNNEFKKELIEVIKLADSNNTITSKQLCEMFDISFRELKVYITELRNEFPIVSKETNGGGYWVAENDNEIKDFIRMIEARKKGYEETILRMKQFLPFDLDCEDNLQHIPFIE